MEFVLDGTAHELDAETVRTVLGGSSPEEVRTHWVEVDGVRWPPKQALALATGLDRAAFTSHRALGVLERLGFATSQWGGARPETRTTRRARPAPGESRAADVVLVGCSGSKAPTARPARELFTGTAFRKARDRAEEAGLPWYVLSARHGLLRPDQVIEPYDAYLPDEPPGVRAAWGRRVVAQLAERHALRDLVLEAHAGAGY